MSSGGHRICVAHLVRKGNDPEALRSFVESYRRHPAGIDHQLLLICKGFEGELPPELEAVLVGIRHARRFIPDKGFDIDAYFDTARGHEAEFFCFLNSYSVIMGDDWLAKLHRALLAAGAGAAGATGSRQSILSNIMDNMALPVDLLPNMPGWKRVLMRWFPFLRTLWRPVRRRLLSGSFAPFPNHHLRTNAFLIPREVALRIRVPVLRKKYDAYKFESGNAGLTRQILAMGRRVIVVGRDGRAYDMDEWHLSNTFWRRGQENLLIADNQTRTYDRSDAPVKAIFSMYAWGHDADPAPQRAMR